MKFGFEMEYFCRKDDQLILVPDGLPYDECGWLVEVRSEPHYNIRKAIALLKAEQEAVAEKAAKLGVGLIDFPLAEVPRDLKVQAARRYGKGLINYRNIYGFETHRNSTKQQTASLHISFTNEQTMKYQDADKRERSFTYQGFIDHAKLIVGLDKAFAEEIKLARRNPGFYEVKQDGRIEYRSLPNNVDLEKVRTVLEQLVQ